MMGETEESHSHSHGDIINSTEVMVIKNKVDQAVHD